MIYSCHANYPVTVDNFYEWYDESKFDSEFYIKSTKILMDKYLIERKNR